jgi:hypothetical protein
MSRAACEDESRWTASSWYCERRAFLVRLRSDPIFLLQHLPALSSAVLRRARTRMSIALSGAHRARKRWPDWLGKRGSIASAGRAGVFGAFDLPDYPAFDSIAGIASAGESPALEPSADPEDQLVQHRWGFLLSAMLRPPVDWQGGLGRCVQWIGVNHDRRLPAWEPYSACERVANLAVFLAAMPAELRQRLSAPALQPFLDHSIDWIYGHLEYYGPSDTNNHILANARALVVAGVAAGHAVAIDAGMRIFHRWLPQLILGGGFLRERSSHYQLIVLNWLMDATHFMAAHAGPDSADAQFLSAYAARMCSAAAMLCGYDCQLLALIGDISPDAAPGLSLARLARLYPGSWPAPQASRSPVEIRDGWFRLSAGRDLVLGNFPVGRFPWQFPTHGHGDVTGFAWIHDGAGILVDPGRYRYTPDAVSLSQAGAAGHNLPTVNGLAPLCESLRNNGQWWPRPYADAQLQAHECAGGIVLAHQGFARATPVTRHARQILIQDGVLTVQDSFDGLGSVDVGWHWHFGPGFDRFDSGNLVARGDGVQLTITVDGLRGVPHVAPLFGTEGGIWISARYGHKQPALCIVLHWHVELPALVSTRFELQRFGAGRQ